MLGFIVGMASLAGLIAVVRAGRRCGGGGCGHGYGGHGGHGHGCGGGWRGHGKHGWGHEHQGGGTGWLRFLFQRLDTTPGQEKEIKAAVEDLFGKLSSLREEGRATRDDIANMLRNDSFDETTLGALFSRHDDKLRDAQKAMADALGRIHTALDAEQRKRLAEMISSGGFRGFGGPYRAGWM